MGTTARVSRRPDCDIHKHREGKEGVPADYDAKTSSGQWGYLCEAHFTSEGCRLGTGLGQKLIIDTKEN